MRPDTNVGTAVAAVRVVTVLGLVLALLTGCFRMPAPRPTAPPDPDLHELFVVAIAPWAQESQRRTGVPASVTIGQAILESGWGDSALSMYAANYFGIKCSQTRTSVTTGCVSMSTTEYDASGTGHTEVASFRSYSRVVDSFVDHGLLLRSLKRYAKAFQHTDDPAAFVTELQAGGYATDPQYATLVTNLITQYGLRRYDDLSTPAPTPDPGASSPAPTTPADSTVAVRGWVPSVYRDEYARTGGPAGPLGYPIGGRRVIGDGSVDVVVCDAGMMINTDARPISLYGPVWQAYRARQADRADLGAPTAAIETLDGVPAMRFSSGIVLARSGTPVVVSGAIGARWIAEGAEGGRLGLPTASAVQKGNLQVVTFRGGTITRDTTTNALTVAYS